MSVRVRAVRPDEWRLWRDLRLRALADSPDAYGDVLAEAQVRDEATWRSQVDVRPDAVRLVAERDGVAVGQMVVVVPVEDARRANVFAMWVAPEARGSGAGMALVRAGLAWARERAALRVWLRCSERHQEARRLYERAGFVATGPSGPLRPGSDVVAHDMEIQLPPLVMGVVNVTPDSFTDGGLYLDPSAAIAHGEELLGQGADILDVGGEATNPRAAAVPRDEEVRRILPVIERLARAGATVSVDTTKADVARRAIDAGASIVNDVAGGLFDPEILEAARDVTYIAGHLRGRSLTEVFAAEGAIPWQDVAAELADRIATLPPTRQVWIDPGIGFGKGADPEGNVALVRHAGDIAATVRRPIVVGTSRKRFLRRLLRLTDPNPSMDVLDAASTLTSLAAIGAGAHVVRVHNVALLRTALSAYNKK